VNNSAPIDATTDLQRCCLGDARLERRLLSICSALQERPSESFPKALANEAATEGLYRFVANENVSWRPILDAHIDATHERCIEAGVILAVHDTTLCQFGGVEIRDGAFRTAKAKSGFLAHTCLAVSADGSRNPLGLLGMIPVVRLPGRKADRSPGTVYELESERWIDLVAIVEDEVPSQADVIHIMDSEGDAYDLLEFMVQQEADFIVRLCHDRRILTEKGDRRLSDALETAVTRLKRTVRLTRRKAAKGKKPGTRHQERDERICTLEVRVTSANLLQPDGSDAFLAGLHLNVVYVVEPDPPEGIEPVCWKLATTLPVGSKAEIEAVIDGYRSRWLIEEWFKSLKTGCSYEERQVESLDGLLTVFAMLAPIATRLLALRWFARNEPDRPATDVLSDEEIRCLRLLEKQKRRTLPKSPTVADVMLAIARLGGFLTRNGTPGWQILGRGFEDFQKMFSVYELMREKQGNGEMEM
jgi:hypothetical protein